jgi:Domain of unknown function (DUF4476)
MKKFILSLCLVTITLFSFAQTTGSVSISTTGNSNLKITFGGKQYSLQDRSVTFQSLTPGTYPLTIFQLQRKSNGSTEYTEVFNNNILLKAQKHLEVSVLRFGKVAWDESNLEPDSWANTGYQPVPGQDAGNNYGSSLTAEEFAELKKSVRNATYDSDKLATGRVILKDNLFTAQQIKELCQLFTYDDHRLDFAKAAYDYCDNRGFYITVLEAFTYQSTKNLLMEYIKTK